MAKQQEPNRPVNRLYDKAIDHEEKCEQKLHQWQDPDPQTELVLDITTHTIREVNPEYEAYIRETKDGTAIFGDDMLVFETSEMIEPDFSKLN